MVPISGYGIIVVLMIYIFCLFYVGSTASPEASRVVQISLIIATAILATILNYFVARFLNKNAVKHTVAYIRLEKMVIYMGVFFVFLGLIMLYGEFK